jgi:nucleotide-binding universal stress UspA family protein
MTSPLPEATRHPFEFGCDGPLAILVGVDGTKASLRAAAYAAGLARRQRSRVVAVFVRQRSIGIAMASMTTPLAAAERDTQDQIEEELRGALQQQARTWGIDAELIVRDGEPLRVLTQVAREVRADAIVVGSSASLTHRVAGSLAVRLVRHARCPVTVVP